MDDPHSLEERGEPSQAELRIAYRDFRDHEAFCRESLSIRDKLGKNVTLNLGPAQKKLDVAIESCRRRGRPVRIIYLKARQVWVSMGTAAEFFHDCAFAPGQKALVVAHETDAATNIFSYYQQMQEHYEPFRGMIDTLPVAANKEGLLAWEGGGYVKVATANNLKTGRSFSLRFLHLSEFAFWRDPKTLMTGLMQAVPDDSNTIVVIESTANGVGGEFHRLWLEASDPTSKSDWIAVFFAWWEHPEYVMDPRDLGYPDRAQFQASLSQPGDEEHDSESELRDQFHLTLDQLAWRRWAIANKCGGSIDTFHQEYPSTPEEAFLCSGRLRFSAKHLNKMPAARTEAKEAGTVGDLEEYYNGPKPVIAFIPKPSGAMVVYKRPSPGKEYVAGVDVTEGKDDSELGSSDPDFGVICICDQATGEQVAKVRGRMEPAALADYAWAALRWYNWAYVCPEANGPGIAFIEQLLRNGYPPALFYHRRPSPDEQFGDNDSTLLSHLGWKQTGNTRLLLISKLDQAIREFSIILTDPHTLSEHLSFVVKANGRAEHKATCHDDEVFAAALAVAAMETAPADRTVGGVHAQKPPSMRVKPSGAVTSYGKRRSTDNRRGIDRGELVRF